MARANRGVQKIMDRCPECGSRKPKELVEGPKRFHLVVYLIFGLCTCGFGLLFFPLFSKRYLQAWCPECETTFDPRF